MNNNDHGMYYKMLQADDGTDVGWLLYSTREIDAGALADELSEVLGPKVGLRWKSLDTGSKTIKTRTRALTVEVSSQVKYTAIRKLTKLYSRVIKPTSEYPNGIRLRFVKLKKDAINAEERSKLDKLRYRQQQFLEGIKSTTSYEILQLDYSNDAGKIPTLRQMIMSLTCLQDKKPPIFHCVDMDWQMDGFVFQYSSDLAEEAETTLNTLLPLLHHHFPKADVGSNFTCEAEDRCSMMYWDKDKNMIVDKDYEGESGIIEDCENLVGFIFDTKIESVNDTSKRPLNKSFMPHDSDSVSTFKLKLGNTFVPSTPSITETPPSLQSSNVDDSLSSITPLQTSSVEATLQSLTSQVQQQQTQFQTLQQMLQQLIASQPPSSAREDSSTGVDQHHSGEEL